MSSISDDILDQRVSTSLVIKKRDKKWSQKYIETAEFILQKKQSDMEKKESQRILNLNAIIARQYVMSYSNFYDLCMYIYFNFFNLFIYLLGRQKTKQICKRKSSIKEFYL